MPKGKFKNPEERSKKLSKILKGKRRSEETRKKISEISKKRRWPEEVKKKMSEAHKGDKNPMKRPEIRKKISETLKGRRLSEEHKRKLKEAHKGKPRPWEKGIPLTKETKKKIAKALKGRIPWNKGLKGFLAEEKHYNWQGGKSFEEYPKKFFELRLAIRTRDYYICQLCGKYPAFDVHHIDYDKKDCEPENLITLCHNCHMKTNYNRYYWINYFSKKL